MQRFFVNKESISGKQVIIADSRVHQIRDVLRMKIGDEIIALNNTGMEYHVRLTDISQKEVAGEIIGRKKCEAEPYTSITLYQSMLARDKFEVVLQKCTEVGVSCFVPIITERSIVRNPEKITKEKLSRYENIISEAAEQSHRGIIPVLRSPINLNQAVSELENYDITLVGSPREITPGKINCIEKSDIISRGETQECKSLKNILQDCKIVPEKASVFIGPEGGFSEKELEVLESRGAKPFSLGKRILRTETAAICTTAIILYELG
jgi:16S rRNA (uracil1498-N3)-methyltransferase